MDDINRLILINQYEILQRLNPEEGNYYSEKIEVLQGGYELHYDELFAELDEPLPKTDSLFVLDVLNMYRDINYSKSNMLDNNEIEDLITEFRGFDFNSGYEGKLGSYARFFIEKLDRFPELIEDSLFESFNSHREMYPQYKIYLEKYRRIKSSDEYEFGNLTIEQLQEILR